MDQELERLYHRLERQREELLALVREQDPEQHHKNVDGRWSINEILAHLITSERLSLLYIQKKSNAINDVDDTGLIEEVKMLLLAISQRLPFRYKAPEFLKQSTPDPTSFSEIEESWQKVREDLHAYLNALHPGHAKRKIYKHPVAGRLNIKHAMKFFSEHITHHLPQVRRLLS